MLIAPILMELTAESMSKIVTTTKLMAANVKDPLGWSSEFLSIQLGIDV